MEKILILEDDLDLLETLEELLLDSGYDVDIAKDGEEAIDKSFKGGYSLYIFDVNVPKINGLELLNYLKRADDKTPTIIISALIDLETISKAFDVGAEDYLKKPFMPEELIIRVNAKLKEDSIVYQNIKYFPTRKEVQQDGIIVPLGPNQIVLVDLFLKNIGKVVTKEMLDEALEYPSSTALRVAINKLKNTLDLTIENIRGVGYIIK